MNQVELIKLSKSYGAQQAVAETSFAVRKGEFFSMVGPSGCGKTTTLRMIAGFVTPSEGRILLQGDDVTQLPPEKRNIGIVFQNYAIFPHMTVAENIGYGLRLRKVGREEIARKVQDALRQVSLDGYGDRSPSQLSGGQQQRVALARVIVLEPRLLLLDEPLSALDRKLRDEMRDWLKQLQHRLGITTIYVTHDQDEALSLSDRIAVMSRGHVQQIGTPTEIYERPSNRFVADFVGESNILPAVPAPGARDRVVLAGGLDCVCAPFDGADGDRAILVRPEKVLLGAAVEAAENRYTGKITGVTYHGAQERFHVQLGDRLSVKGERPNLGQGRLDVGGTVDIGWKRDSATLLAQAGAGSER